MLTNKFFDRDAVAVAKDLLGKVVRVKYHDIWLAAMIIETEAYYLREKGSHASLGFTEKRKALFMPAGTIYMYHAHGGDSLNTSCAGAGNAVLFKSGIPYIDPHTPSNMLDIMHQLNPKKKLKRHDKKLCSGQTLLCKSLGLKVKVWDQKSYDPDYFFIDDVGYRPHKIIQTPRLGIPKGRDEHLMLRFIDYDFAAFTTSNPLTKKKLQFGKDYKIINLTPLEGLKVLLIRPKKQAQLLAKKIQAAGGKTILFPTLTITKPHDKTSLRNALQQIANFDIAIFTSANAVTNMGISLKKISKKTTIIATGPGTSKALTKHFTRITIPASPYTSEMMLQLPQLQTIDNKNIVIFTGEGGRDILTPALKAKKANVIKAIVYRRECAQLSGPPQWQPKEIDIIVGTSFEALQNLLQMLPNKKQQLLKKPVLVSSERLYSLAQEIGFQKLIKAENASEEAIFNALKAWYSSSAR